MRPSLGRFARGLCVLAAGGSVLMLLVTLVPVWPFTLFEHFRLQYLVVGCAVVAACAALRVRVWFDAAAIATLVHALWIVPDLTRTPRPLPPNGEQLRVLMFNVHGMSTAFDDVRRVIEDTNADVVALLEVRERWITELAPALARYPHRYEYPLSDNSGLALYARGPVTAQVAFLGQYPSIIGSLEHAGRTLDIVVTHPYPPVTSELLDELHEQISALSTHVRTLAHPTILAGDFNSTPWSRPFRQLVANSGLCDTRAGFGYQGSFPTWFAPMRIPIDHVLVSCDIGVRARQIGRHAGSDHLPVIVDLVVP